MAKVEEEEEDRHYAMGTRFLGLPARATRDGQAGPGSVVGTAVHLELLGVSTPAAPMPAPPYLALAFEPATGAVIGCTATPHDTGFGAYEDALWSFIAAFLESLDSAQHKPATLMTFDPGLADYVFGLLQGCGTDVVCVGPTQPVPWPEGGQEGLLLDAMQRVIDRLLQSGQAAAAMGVPDLGSEAQLQPLRACHNGECGRLLPKAEVKRCGGCKRSLYCGAACQRRHWTAGGHKQGCKDIQAMNAPLEAAQQAVVDAGDSLPLSAMFDGHCHWHLGGDLTACTKLASTLSGAAFTSTRPDDWEAATLCAREGNGSGHEAGFGLCLGLHPWWAHHHALRDSDSWVNDLRSRLLELPAAAVGEIGLDRVAVPINECGEVTGEPDYPNQLQCFETQLALATELQRPVVVHCVKAYGDIADRFRAADSMPPRVLMHSFGGSQDYMLSLTRMKRWGSRFFFGFSAAVNLRSPKTGEVVTSCPDDRILLESDLVSENGAESDLRTMLAFIAECKGWSTEEAARVTRENALRFYGLAAAGK